MVQRGTATRLRDLDLPLIGGSAVFGIGWGIAGFCPGGALPALGTGMIEVAIFVASLIAGLLTARVLRRVGVNALTKSTT